MKKISAIETNDIGKDHVTQLLDTFEHHGPNGTHQCLAFDVMGPSSTVMFENLPKELRGTGSQTAHEKRGRYPLWMAKSLLRQVLLGLDFLHRNDIIHGDVQPGNVLFSVKALECL